ncbi:O-antigen ligase family protein [Candidatus Omnitrophota bacterium]
MEKMCRILEKVTRMSIYALLFSLPISKAMIEVCSIVAIGTWITRKTLYFFTKTGERSFVTIPTKLLIPVLLLTFAQFLSVLFSVNILVSFEAFFTKSLEYILLYVIVADSLNTKKRLNIAFSVILVSAVIVSIDAMIQAVGGRDILRMLPLHGTYLRDLRACFKNPNAFAGWILLVIPVMVGYAHVGKKGVMRIINILALSTAGFLVFCLFMTQARAALIGLIFQVGLLLYWLALRFKLFHKVGVLLILMGIICSIFLLSLEFNSENSIWDSFQKDSRAVLWQEALLIIKDYPIFGAGLNTYAQIAPHYKLFENGGSYPHNSYLHMAAESGCVTLIAFFWLVICLFLYILHSKYGHTDRILLGISVGIAGFLIHSFFDTSLHQIQLAVLFWVFMGLAIARVKLGDEITHA